MDSFRPAPPTITIQLESVPPGADAVTSIGPGCKTPCSVAVPAANTFTVSYTLAKYQPATIPVPIDPNPVVAELQPAVPPRRQVRRGPAKKKKQRAAPAAAAAAPAAASPFPAPR